MRQRYTPEQRAQVTAALLAGQAVNQVAKEYKMPKSTVSRWKTDALKGRFKKDGVNVGDLLLDYLQENLHALRKQAALFGDHNWLRKQNAADIAVLHGIMTDKAIRLLEAYGRASEESDE